jgi:FAD/FMN-containing dehydrogenase
MDRRKFCKTTLAAAVAAATPFLPGCDREAKVATTADTSIRGISLDGAEIELERAAIRELGEALSGPVMLSGHPEYDGSRRVWNGMHDKRPALIARCLSSEDVSHAVSFARERNLLTAVRGGGHSWPGKSTCDDGLMIDLSHMVNVAVDRDARRALVAGGALLGHLDDAALAQGLVTTAGVVSHTGVGGFTLGGGFGRLNRKYGLAVDNVRSAEIITADGRIRSISAEEEPDLFWAIRGGGGNFGVVTQFEFELYPFDRNVLSGMLVWPIDQAREVLEFYGEWYTGLSDELYVRAVGTPMDDGIKMQDYKVMQTQEDGTFGHGIRSYAKNGMVREITQALVDAMIESFVADPRMAMFTHTAGGAAKRVGETDTAFPHRQAETMIIVGGGWHDPAMDDEAMAIGRSWFAKLAPYTGGYYDNIQFRGEESANNYGPNYARLAGIKGQYDPGNLFRLNSNIAPAKT